MSGCTLTEQHGALAITGIFCDTCDQTPLLIFATRPDPAGQARWYLPADDPALARNPREFVHAGPMYAVSSHMNTISHQPLTTHAALDLCLAHLYPGEPLDLDAYGAAHLILGLDNEHIADAVSCYTLARTTNKGTHQ